MSIKKTSLCLFFLLLKAAGLHPTAEQIEMFAYHLPDTTLSNLIVSRNSLLNFFSKNVDVSGNYWLTSLGTNAWSVFVKLIFMKFILKVKTSFWEGLWVFQVGKAMEETVNLRRQWIKQAFLQVYCRLKRLSFLKDLSTLFMPS